MTPPLMTAAASADVVAPAHPSSTMARVAAAMRTAHPFWVELFGNTGPVEIEIGCADGSFLLAAAARSPWTNYLGIEWSARRASKLAKRITGAFGGRVRVLRADAACVVANVLPASSVDAYHVYFPDPWPKRRHGERRLLGPAFVEAAARTLVDGGRLHLATDVGTYIASAERAIVASRYFQRLDSSADAPGLRTTFARKYQAQGRPLHAASFGRVDRDNAWPE